VVIPPRHLIRRQPVYCQTTPITGTDIRKNAVGVRSAASADDQEKQREDDESIGPAQGDAYSAIIKRAVLVQGKTLGIHGPEGPFVPLMYPN